MSSSDVSAELDHDAAESESESSPAAEPTSTAAGALRRRRCQAGGAQGAGSNGRGGCALGEQAARRLAGPAGLVLRVLALEPVVIARVHGVQPGAELRELGRRVLVLLRRSAQAGVRRSHARGTLAARSLRRRPTLSRLRSPSAAPARPSPRRRGPRRGCPCRRRSCSWRWAGRAAGSRAADVVRHCANIARAPPSDAREQYCWRRARDIDDGRRRCLVLPSTPGRSVACRPSSTRSFSARLPSRLPARRSMTRPTSSC